MDSYSDCTWGVISTLLPLRSIVGRSKVESEGNTCKKQVGEQAGGR